MKRTFLLPLLFFALLFSSCYKEPITKGVITVYDPDGNTKAGVNVRLTQEDIPGINQTYVVSEQTTDENGQSEHLLEKEAVMNIDAVFVSGLDTLYYGQSTIRFIYGKTINKNVQLLAY